MANEITIGVGLRAVKDSVAFVAVESKRDDWTGSNGQKKVQTIGTTEETITFTDVTNKGWIRFRNLDATNYVQIGPDNGGTISPFIRLGAGQVCVIKVVPSVTVKAIANTADVDLEICGLEV